MRNRIKAFSLIELVVVVSILVLLAGVLIPVVSNEMQKAMVGKATTDMKTLAEAYNRYFIHTGFWPTTAKNESFATAKNFAFTSMNVLYTNAHNRKNWAGPYLGAGVVSNGAWQVAVNGPEGWQGFVDPWGTPYRMFYFPKGGAMGPFGGIAILSYGKNAKIDSVDADVAAGTAKGDDVAMIITRSL